MRKTAARWWTLALLLSGCVETSFNVDPHPAAVPDPGPKAGALDPRPGELAPSSVDPSSAGDIPPPSRSDPGPRDPREIPPEPRDPGPESSDPPDPSSRATDPESQDGTTKGLTRLAHGDFISSVAFSPDGKFFATATETEGIRIFDASTWKKIAGFGRDADFSLAFLPDGKSLVSVDFESRISFWDVPSGKPGRKLEPFGKDGAVEAAWEGGILVSPDGKSLAVRNAMDWGGTAAVIDLATGKERFRIGGGEDDEIFSVVFSPDGKSVAVSGLEDRLALLDAGSGEARWRQDLPEDSLAGPAAFSPDGRVLAAAWDDGAIHLLDPATGEERAAFPGGEEAEWISLGYSPDGRFLAATDPEGTISLFEAATGSAVCSVAGANLEDGPEPAFSPDGRRLAFSLLEDDAAAVWNFVEALAGEARAVEAGGIEESWKALADADAAKAHRAAALLAVSGEKGAALLRERLTAGRADTRAVGRLIAALDAEKFDERERASAELSRLGEAAESPLREALGKELSLEARARVEDLLRAWDGPLLRSPEALQRHRAVFALELAGTPEAKAALEAVAKAAPGSRLAREAAGALARIQKFPAQNGKAGETRP